MRFTSLLRGRSAVLLALGVVMVAACGGTPRRVVATYDFGDIAAPVPLAVSVGRVEVVAPSWLETPGMQYRLEQEPARRQIFADSRWAATPAELLGAALRRQWVNGSAAACRVTLELDELVQRFDAAGESRLSLMARVRLYAARGDAVLGRQAFQIEQPAGRDAKSGVAAAQRAQRQLAEAVAAWSRELRVSSGQCGS
jgi:cholesterol transport system auxiliary component